MASASPARRSAYSYPKVTAALEIAAYLSMTGIAAIAYTFGWLSLNQAGMCALLLVLMLVLLAWVRFDGGRHPCFLFLGIFPIFQAGHLIAYAMGALPDPFMVRFLAPHPFDITPTPVQCFFVLCLAAICIYAPCRWNYQGVSPIRAKFPGSVLPYLYLVFGISLPFAILENVLYFRYASAHGGYLVLFTQRAALIASVPILIRAGSNLLTPAFLAIFVLESRRIRLYAATAIYFFASSFFLLIGSRRGHARTMILALWYISQIERARRCRILPVAVFPLLLDWDRHLGRQPSGKQ